MSQQQLSQELHRRGVGIPQQTVARIEQGKQPLRVDQIDAILQLLGVTFEEFRDGVPKPSITTASPEDLIDELQRTINLLREATK